MKAEHDVTVELARDCAERITRRTISSLCAIKDTLSGEDSGLVNVWEEICVQVRGEHTFFWPTYELTVEATVGGFVSKLKHHEKVALWLQTESGLDWMLELPTDRMTEAPFCENAIVDHIVQRYVYQEAEGSTNYRVQKFLATRYID